MRHAFAVPALSALAVALSAACGAAAVPPPAPGPAGGVRNESAAAEVAAPAVAAPEAAVPAAVEDALRRQRDRLRPCWDRLVLDHPDVVAGRATVWFRIDPSGRVLSAELLSGPVEDPSFRACVEQRAREMNFPQGDAPGVFPHSFEFGAPAGGGVE